MVFFVRITVNQSHLRPICKSTKFNPKIQRTIYLINFQQLRLHVPDFIRTVVILLLCYIAIYLYIYIVIALFIYSVVCLLLYCMLTALGYYFLYIYILFLFLTSTSIFYDSGCRLSIIWLFTVQRYGGSVRYQTPGDALFG